MRLNFIFTGGDFPYMYYRAIDTALKVHEHDKAYLYFTEPPKSDKYWNLLNGRILFVYVDKSKYDYAIGLNKGDKFYNSNVKDLILWENAYEHGGIFLDLDTISYKDISCLLEKDKDMVVADDASPDKPFYHHFNADICVVRAKSELIKTIRDAAIEKSKDPNLLWGGLNPILLTEIINANRSKVFVPEHGVLGGFTGLATKDYYEGKLQLPDNCRVLHLFAGAYPQYAYRPEWKWTDVRGKHYKAMFDYIADHKVKNILEIGTYDGNNAIGMIKTSKAPENEMSYTGIDLFITHDQELLDTEIGYGYGNPPDISDVEKKLKQETLAKITLYKGDSKKILPKIKGKFDLIYIDGGHSLKTIQSDWENAERLISKDGVIFFDDYFVDRDDIGCKFLYEKIKQKWDVTLHPECDNYGRFSSKLMSVRAKSASKKSKKYRFHVLGLVHLPTSKEYMGCAFTQKNYKLCKMLVEMGHDVFLYGAEGSNAPCTKFIQTHSLREIRDAWGDGDNRFEIGYNWKSGQFRHDFNDAQKKPVTMKFYQNAITEINFERRADDFLVITQGTYQRPVDKGVGLPLTVESGIGYRGSYTRFRSWESSYIQNFTYGSENPRESINGRYYDRIIPNYFDAKDFPFQSKKEDYFLFMGRLIQRKGVMTAILACEALGAKLKLAGQLSDEISLEQLKKYKCVDFVGYADAKKRAELMGKAKAVFCPSTYLEPFCGVHAEAMLCGTPVLTTNFGAFTDYVIDGVNGYKCDTLNDFVQNAKKVSSLSPKAVRATAERFTLESVSKQYQKWFDDLYQWYLSTTDSSIKGWHYIKTE